MTSSHLRAASAFYVTGALAAVAAAYVIHAALPPNPLALPGEQTVQAQALLPEGWAFFTKTPRTPEVLVYHWIGNGWRDVHEPTLAASGRLDLSRDPRRQGIEMGLLLHDLGEDVWQRCDQQVLDCLTAAPIVADVTNTEPGPTVCGDVGVAQRQRVPWSFRNNTTADEMPSIVVRLRVACP